MGIRQHVRSNIIGYVALFFALSSGAYALQGKNTVNSGDIKNNKVKSADIKDNGVEGIDVAEATLDQVPSAQTAQTAQTASAVGPDAVTGAGVLDGSLTGADIDEATLGAPTAGLQFVSAQSATNSDSPKTATPECPVGTRYIAYGYDISGGKTGAPPNELTDVVLDEASPNADGRRIIFTADEEDATAGNWSLSGSAVCINAP